MGVRRSSYQLLLKEPLHDVIIIDIDKGEYRVMGGLPIRDFVGESGTALQQASEGLDRLQKRAAGMANILMRSAGAQPMATGTGPPTDTGRNKFFAYVDMYM